MSVAQLYHAIGHVRAQVGNHDLHLSCLTGEWVLRGDSFGKLAQAHESFVRLYKFGDLDIHVFSLGISGLVGSIHPLQRFQSRPPGMRLGLTVSFIALSFFSTSGMERRSRSAMVCSSQPALQSPGGHPKCPTYGHPNCSTLAAVI